MMLIGFLAAILILTVAAAESSIGLAILVTFYRLKGGIGLNLITALKG
jgi:NADH-quinone oxidoreductase subunit K